MLRKTWFGGVFKPKNLHSLEHLRYLYSVLSKNQVVSDSNRGLLVETLRSIAEILIWGDQNDSSVFDFFLEKQMLAFFLRIMKQKCGSYVCVQLLQTLNILFENIRNETSLYYLLSNNHVNYIIEHKFDFSDEEVMAYYISFLKTLSFKLNNHTIHFFYNEHTNDFPLYTEAIKFFNHPESMVRIAVRTLTLNVYRVNDRSMLQFIRDRTAVPYFSNLVWFIGNHILELDACVRDDIDHDSRDRLSGLVAEHLDHLHYLNDILRLHITPLNHLLAHHLLHRLLLPLLVNSLLPPDSPVHRFTGHRQEPADVHSDSATEDDSGPVVRRGRAPRVSKVVALFLLAQVFLILSFPPLINTLARYLMHAGTSLLLHYNKSSSPPVTGFVAPKESLEKSLLSHGVSSPYRTRAGSAAMAGEEQLCERAEVATPTPPAERDPALGAGGSEADLTAELQSSLNITDEEKQQMLTYQLPPCCLDVRLRGGDEEEGLDSRPFLQSVVEALSCTDSDYTALFALCLLYALGHNAGFSNSGCPVTASSDEPSKNHTSAPQDDHSSTKAEPISSRSSSPVELQTELSSHPKTSDVPSPMLKSTNSPNADGVVLRDNDNLPTGLDVRETSLSREGVGAPCGGEDDRTSTCSREDIPGKSSSSDYHSGAESCYCPTDASDGSEVCQAAAHKGTILVASEKSRQHPCMAEPSTDQSEPRVETISSGDPGRPPACSSDSHQPLKACDDVRRSSGVESARVEEGSKRRSSEAKHHSVKPYNSLLVEKMLQVISLSTQYNSKVRVVTLEIAIQVLKQVVGLTSTSTGNCNYEASSPCNGETASDALASESVSSSPSKCSKPDDAPVPVPASVVFSASCSCPEATGEGPCVSCSALPRASVASGEAPMAGGAAAGSESAQCAAADVSGSACEAGNQQSRDLSSASVACATDEARGRPPRSRGLNKVVLYDEHLAVLEGAKEEATLVLRNYYKSEEMFLDLFEDEWSHSGCGKSEARRPISESLRVEYLLQDSNILLPPTATPLTGIQLNKRRPCGEVERARRAMRVFFLVRSACLAVRGEQDTQLPLTRPSACVRVDDVLDLNNSDLIACVVITRDGERCRRFLVIDVLQLILVEPDQRRLGWGVAKFVGFLQYLEVNGDKDDSRVLHLTIHHPASAAAASTAASSMRASSRTAPPAPLLSAKFIFDDHIRCMAAKQRLCKGRNKARQRKLHQIARLLELPSHLLPCPSPPSHPLSAMRLEAHHHHRRGLGGHRSTDGRSGSRSGRSGRVPGRAAHQTHGGGLGGAADGGGGRVAVASSSASELTRAALGEEIQLEDISGQSLSASQGGHPYLRRL